MTDTILRKRDIKRITGLSDVTIRLMEAAGTFPSRFTINPNGRLVGWKSTAIQAWIDERGASRVAA